MSFSSLHQQVPGAAPAALSWQNSDWRHPNSSSGHKRGFEIDGLSWKVTVGSGLDDSVRGGGRGGGRRRGGGGGGVGEM